MEQASKVVTDVNIGGVLTLKSDALYWIQVSHAFDLFQAHGRDLSIEDDRAQHDLGDEHRCHSISRPDCEESENSKVNGRKDQEGISPEHDQAIALDHAERGE